MTWRLLTPGRVVPNAPRPRTLTEDRVRAIIRDCERIRADNARPGQQVHMLASADADELIELCESWIEWRRTP